MSRQRISNKSLKSRKMKVNVSKMEKNTLTTEVIKQCLEAQTEKNSEKRKRKAKILWGHQLKRLRD